jgi:hypothetical protein
VKWTIAIGTARAPDSVEQRHRPGQHNRQDDLRKDAVRPSTPELDPRRVRREDEHVEVGNIRRDHQCRGAKASASIEARGAARGPNQRVADVIHERKSKGKRQRSKSGQESQA